MTPKSTDSKILIVEGNLKALLTLFKIKCLILYYKFCFHSFCLVFSQTLMKALHITRVDFHWPRPESRSDSVSVSGFWERPESMNLTFTAPSIGGTYPESQIEAGAAPIG